MLVFNEKEIWFHCETNPYDRFPKFEAISESLSNFEAVFRQFVMNLSDFFWLQTTFTVHGRANPSKNVSCNQFSLSWGPSKILHPLSGGRHSRLSIYQTQRKYQQILRRQCCLFKSCFIIFLSFHIITIEFNDFSKI